MYGGFYAGEIKPLATEWGGGFASIRIDLPETCKRKVSRRDCLIVIRIWFDIDTLDCAAWKFLFRLSEILSDKWQMDNIPIFVVHRFP